MRSLNPRWWNPIWLLSAIGMIFSYIVLYPSYIMFIWAWEIICLIIAYFAYNIQIESDTNCPLRTSKKVKRTIYMFGLPQIGFSCLMIYYDLLFERLRIFNLIFLLLDVNIFIPYCFNFFVAEVGYLKKYYREIAKPVFPEPTHLQIPSQVYRDLFRVYIQME